MKIASTLALAILLAWGITSSAQTTAPYGTASPDQASPSSSDQQQQSPVIVIVPDPSAQDSSTTTTTTTTTTMSSSTALAPGLSTTPAEPAKGVQETVQEISGQPQMALDYSQNPYWTPNVDYLYQQEAGTVGGS